MEWVFLEETDSTNRVAKELARQGAPHGTAVLAKRQTAGRGRLGRSFFSPEGGLYLSVILRPQCKPEDLALMTPMAAVAVCRALEQVCAVSPRIKWVNDLYLGDKKVCGILCEAVGTAVIVGIGLNLKAPEGGFPPDINAAALQVSLQPSVVAEAIVEELRKSCYGLRSRDFLEDYRKYNMVLQRELMIHPMQGAPYPAWGKTIDHRGRLVVETADGNEQVLDSGEVSIGLYTKRSEQG